MRYETRGAEKFYYFYDASGVISGFRHVNSSGTATLYYTLTNAQGDVIAIYDQNGALVGSYEYDAWGKVVKMTDGSGSVVDEDNTTEIVSINAIRYRGYYYDKETKLYYLQSRYYNPDVGRFLNADGMLNGNGDILGYNMFAYCGNNPVNYSDPSGCGKFDVFKAFVYSVFNAIRIEVNRKIYKNQVLPYESVNEAAIASGKILNSKTQATNLEYGQGIIYNKKTETYGLTSQIQEGFHSRVNLTSILSADYGNNSLVALVHSHPYCTGHIPDVFSGILTDENGNITGGDWYVSTSNKIDLYLASPTGTLYVMNWDMETHINIEIILQSCRLN